MYWLRSCFLLLASLTHFFLVILNVCTLKVTRIMERKVDLRHAKVWVWRIFFLTMISCLSFQDWAKWHLRLSLCLILKGGDLFSTEGINFSLSNLAWNWFGYPVRKKDLLNSLILKVSVFHWEVSQHPVLGQVLA